MKNSNISCLILALYKDKGLDFVDDLNGIFGFAIYDANDDSYFIARDHMGIIPLYIGWDENGTFYVASELKALEGFCTKIELFPPGHYLSSKSGEYVKWYNREWIEYDVVKDNETSIEKIKEALEFINNNSAENLSFVGLMTMATWRTDDPEAEARSCFPLLFFTIFSFFFSKSYCASIFNP